MAQSKFGYILFSCVILILFAAVDPFGDKIFSRDPCKLHFNLLKSLLECNTVCLCKSLDKSQIS
jgi:hypothetical protein